MTAYRITVVQFFHSKECRFKAVEVPHWWPEVSWCQRNSMANYLPVMLYMIDLWYVTAYTVVRSVFHSKDCHFKAVEVSDWWPEVSWCKEVLRQILLRCNQPCYVLIYLNCGTAYTNTRGQFFVPKTVVLKLWKFLIDDLKSLGAKKFYGKFSSVQSTILCIDWLYIGWQADSF